MPIPDPSTELVYAPAIAILAGDLYPEKAHIVREYIQNASDAIDAFREVAEYVDDRATPLIKIMIQGHSLVIWDNGIGMDGEEVQKLKRIAYSEKREGRDAGYKGIGRLAGIAVAKKLIISTTSLGDPKLHRFEFRAKDLLDDIDAKKREGVQESASHVINTHTSISSDIDVDPNEHYTMVELRDIDEHPELLDPFRLAEYIGEMAPVGFSPDFRYGKAIARELAKYIPDYSPKAIWITSAMGTRTQIFKPYTDMMSIAEPGFIEVSDPADPQKLLAFCWYASKGQDMCGKFRPAGKKFTVDGTTVEAKERLAGLCYKLFGFTVGGRTLPLTTLWEKDYTRPLWFTGEVHVIDKGVKPTTDRSDFVESAARQRLFVEGRRRVAQKLNARAQEISDDRLANEQAEKWLDKYEKLEAKLAKGALERAEIKGVKADLDRSLAKDLDRKCDDLEIREFLLRVRERGRALRTRIDEARSKGDIDSQLADLARELNLPTHARKVYRIIMETVDAYFAQERDSFYELSDRIQQALRKKL
jgi:hypothetical protein